MTPTTPSGERGESGPLFRCDCGFETDDIEMALTHERADPLGGWVGAMPADFCDGDELHD